MYDEFKEDLKEQFKGEPRKKSALWGKAIKSILEEKKKAGIEISVRDIAKKAKLNEKNLFNIIAQRIHDPSSDKLVRIAEALGVSFLELAARALGESPVSLFHGTFNQRCRIDYSQHGFSINPLTPPATGARDFFAGLMMIKPLTELKKWKFKDNSTVFLFLESGTLELTYGNLVKQIHSNESVYFDGAVPHKIKNTDSVEARLFLVTRPAII